MLATTVQLSEQAVKAIEEASKHRGFASTSAFIRYAVEQELAGRRDELHYDFVITPDGSTITWVETDANAVVSAKAVRIGPK